MKREVDGEASEERAELGPRRPYAPPRISTSEAFERLALGCNGASVPGPAKLPGFNECLSAFS